MADARVGWSQSVSSSLFWHWANTCRNFEETGREESSVHIEIQVSKQGQQHYANQNHPDDSKQVRDALTRHRLAPSMFAKWGELCFDRPNHLALPHR